VEIIVGGGAVLGGLLQKEFTPIGLTTWLIWGTGKDARIPRWIAATFYVLLGLTMLYFGLTGK
jgi:hypothetical protein